MAMKGAASIKLHFVRAAGGYCRTGCGQLHRDIRVAVSDFNIEAIADDNGYH
jgi:hypothetical protein